MSEGMIIPSQVGKFRIQHRIGSGSFGEIHLGYGPLKEKVAVKFEKVNCPHPQLRHEYKVYRHMSESHGFGSAVYYGLVGETNAMVMDLLGPSLESLFEKSCRKFSLKTVLQLADQLLDRLNSLHARNLIHRDIKPHNFVMGLGDKKDVVYCIDFGLAKLYCDPKTGRHNCFSDFKSLTGTPRYASINNHLGRSSSRRDDLESLAYVLIYFLRGSLPWQRLEAKSKEAKYKMILQKKQEISIEELCLGMPPQFAEFLKYSRSLTYEATPDITRMRKMFRSLYEQSGFCVNSGPLWDWDVPPAAKKPNVRMAPAPHLSYAKRVELAAAAATAAARGPAGTSTGAAAGGVGGFGGAKAGSYLPHADMPSSSSTAAMGASATAAAATAEGARCLSARPSGGGMPLREKPERHERHEVLGIAETQPQRSDPPPAPPGPARRRATMQANFHTRLVADPVPPPPLPRPVAAVASEFSMREQMGAKDVGKMGRRSDGRAGSHIDASSLLLRHSSFTTATTTTTGVSSAAVVTGPTVDRVDLPASSTKRQIVIDGGHEPKQPADTKRQKTSTH